MFAIKNMIHEFETAHEIIKLWKISVKVKVNWKRFSNHSFLISFDPHLKDK